MYVLKLKLVVRNRRRVVAISIYLWFIFHSKHRSTGRKSHT